MSANPLSFQDAVDLLKKLLDERIPVHAHFMSGRGADARVAGFVDSLTQEVGIVISPKGPLGDTYLAFPIAEDCTFFFGDKRELPPERRDFLAAMYGDASLVITTRVQDTLSLFFTI
jgi:hypothetical protein